MDSNSGEAGPSCSNPPPPSDTKRLPSFKGPRDLTLSSPSSAASSLSSSSAAQRVLVPGLRSAGTRKFAPNIPIKRERTVNTESSSSSRNNNNNYNSNRHDRGNNRGGRPDRGGGRGRGGPNDRGRGGKRTSEFVEAEGAIFSQGIGDGTVKSKQRAPSVSGGGTRSGSGAYSSGVARKGDKNDPELMETIKEISNRTIMKSKYKQIFGTGKSFISDLKQADEDGLEKAVTLPLSSCLSRLVFVSADVPEEPITTRSLTSSSSSSRKKRSEKNTFASIVSKLPPDGTIILLQLPENLPYFREMPTEKEGNGNSSSSEGGNTTKELAKTINEIPEGLIAQFETLSTGESRIVMGNSCFELTAGTRPGFYQELLLDEEDGFTSLGAVQYKYIGIPNVESVLDSNVQS